ncbi:hypothetical protein Tco_0982377, partial [Tanacetum coccineum]
FDAMAFFHEAEAETVVKCNQQKRASPRYLLKLGLSSNVASNPIKKRVAHTKVCLLLFSSEQKYQRMEGNGSLRSCAVYIGTCLRSWT